MAAEKTKGDCGGRFRNIITTAPKKETKKTEKKGKKK